MKSVLKFFSMLLEAIQDGKRLRAETRTKHFRIA
jgi:hypothetical protein